MKIGNTRKHARLKISSFLPHRAEFFFPYSRFLLINLLTRETEYWDIRYVDNNVVRCYVIVRDGSTTQAARGGKSKRR